MKFLCVIGGCIWADEAHAQMGNEDVLCQCCSRCGAHRYLSDHYLSDRYLSESIQSNATALLETQG